MEPAKIWLLAVIVTVICSSCQTLGMQGRVRELLAPGKPFNPPVTGEFQILGVGPVAATHTVQLPQTNDFLIIDFLNDDPHPAMNADGTRILWVYHRDTNTYTNVPSPVNLVCGGWTRLPDGNIAMFGGHGPFYNLRRGEQDLFVYNTQTGLLADMGGMLQPRWYASALTLPDGKAYVFGGTTVVGAYSKSVGAESFNPANGQKQLLPVNDQLMAAGIGNFYVGAWVLPTGNMVVFNSRLVQVIDIYSGAVLAGGPPLPGGMANLRWEYPYTSTMLLLTIPPAVLGKPATTWDFVIFGGNTEGANELTVCSDTSLRISVSINNGGGYVFGPWVVEQMPGPRCQMDSVLLPNGKVLLVNGQEMGIGGLPDAPLYACGNCGNEPVTEPWEYNPLAPAGQRYTRTGAFSTIPRLYHGTGLLTSEGDVLLGGCTNCGRSLKAYKYNMALYSRTQLGNSEYRLEIYHPRYVFSPLRPKIAMAPKAFAYGSVNAVTFTLAAGSGPITKVVLQDTGTTTHGHTMNRRQLELRFTNGNGVLQVVAPMNGNWAAPGWYLLFLLVGDVYSQGRWVQLAGQAPPQPEVPLPADNAGGQPGGWTCMPYEANWLAGKTHIAVRAAGADVECLSPENALNTCQGFINLGECNTYIVGKQGNAGLTCGAEHAALYVNTGYNDANHWCDMAMALVGGTAQENQPAQPAPKQNVPQQPAPKQNVPAGQAGAWTCIPFQAIWFGANTHVAVRNVNGDVECLSPVNGQPTCEGFNSLANCNAYIVGKENQATLTCGAEHAQIYGDTGYNVAGHWCTLGMAVVGQPGLPPQNNAGNVPIPVDNNPAGQNNPYGGPWTCMPFQAPWFGANTHLAVRHANFGPDVQCLSPEIPPAGGKKTCQGFGSLQACNTFIVGKEASPAMTCGNEHLLMYGNAGYNDPGHWCDQAVALVGRRPGGNQQVAGGNAGWACIHFVATWLPEGQGFHAVRYNQNNDVECLSLDAQGCVLYATQASCQNLVGAQNPALVQPLSCGAMHAQQYGDTGYATPGHWCWVGQAALAARR